MRARKRQHPSGKFEYGIKTLFRFKEKDNGLKGVDMHQSEKLANHLSMALVAQTPMLLAEGPSTFNLKKSIYIYIQCGHFHTYRKKLDANANDGKKKSQ